jgi:PAS domain S-box-containing protein
MPKSDVTPTILVVDDDVGLLILIESALLAEKWQVVTAASGAEALSWLQKHTADLLLLDLKLSDIEGRELIARLNEVGHKIPFIIVTGQGDERVAVEMMKRGALDYLVKDINFLEFVPTVVRRVLARLADEKRLAQAEIEAAESRTLTQTILNSLSANIAVLDREGNIIAVNEPWRNFSVENGGSTLLNAGVGANYLEVCRRAAARNEPGTAEMLAGIQMVMNRTTTDYSAEYPCHSTGRQRWFVMTVTPLSTAGGGVVIAHTDISRSKQAEELLREERDFSSAVLDTAGALVIVLDEHGNVVRFNRECERVTGYAAAEIVCQPLWNLLLPPEEVAAVRSVFMQLRGGQAANRFENCWLTKSKNRRLIAWSNTILTNPNGTVKHVIGTGLDITERKRDEQRRQLQYETSRLLAASEPISETIPKLLQTVAKSLQWEVAEFWEVSGEPEELRIVHVWHAPGKQLAAFVKSSLKLSLSMFDGLPGLVLATRKPQWIPSIAECSHMVRKLEASQAGLHSALAFPVQLDHEIQGVMAFLTHRPTEPDEDLLQMFASLGSQIGQFMERKSTEEALREANEFGDQVISGAQAGIIVCDRNGKLVVWNPFMEQISGCRAEETVGLRAVEALPSLREQHFDKLIQQALDGEVFEAADIPFDHPTTGKRCWTTARFAPWRDARRKIVGVIIAVRDITERRRLEAELLEISDREQQRIGHDLHDGLGQQLTGLEMKNFLLLEDLSEPDLNAHREQLQNQAHQISVALRNCVTLTRALARGLAPVNVKAGGLIGALKELAHNTTLPGKIECRLVCRASLELDNSQIEGHLYRIAQEAVNNALKHAQPKHIRISLTHERGWLRLQIKDDGRGLPVRKKSKPGMGLEVMRHRAHVIGGVLEIESKPDHGVQVTCILPLKEA